MPRGASREELRASQAASSDAFVATDPIYKELHARIHDEALSANACAKYYVDQITALAAESAKKRDMLHFVEVFGGSIVELAARTSYRDADVRRRLVEFVHELQKTTVKDPQSATGEPLHFHDDQESILWKDLPEFWLACAEERASFVPWDLTNTPREMGRWKNLAAFWAEQSLSRSTDHSKHALDAFHEAFELVEEGEQTGNRGFLLETACIWLINGMEWIWPRVSGRIGEWQIEKWHRWKRSLEDSRRTVSRDETMALIEEALATMDKAEQGSAQ